MGNRLFENVGMHLQDELLFTQLGFYVDKQDTEFTYTFENFFHPFVGELIEKLNRESLPGMLDPEFHASLSTRLSNPPANNTFFTYFKDFYQKPSDQNLVIVEGFPKEIDVREGGPYANYNWELFFHIPLAIAVHLSKNQRFAEAQRWFHYIFDPTCNDTSIPTPQRYWKFLAFRDGKEPTQIDELLALLSKKDPTDEEKQTQTWILRGYEAIKNKPFQPHAVARTRRIAYQFSVVMKYLDNLIAWGDSLFRQDTIESINEATMRYVLAANLLGARPQRIPPPGSVQPKTFAELKAKGLDRMGNALVDLEGKFPLNISLPPPLPTNTNGASPLFGIGRTLYFCIPRNEKLLGYWDNVADRLYKIRNCMNIEGIVRQLALFDPPLDPGMLVKAAAAGIDIGSILSGLNQPIGPVRCLFYIQKALEIAGEVRGLGSALLSAIEKKDGEHLALLRQGHEIKIQQMTQEVRFLQWKQAQEGSESLLRSRQTAFERFRFYQRLLGRVPDGSLTPDILPLVRSELTEENFDEAYSALVGQYEKAPAVLPYPQLSQAGDTSPSIQSGASSSGKLFLLLTEEAELNKLLPAARDLLEGSSVVATIASVLTYLPEVDAKLAFWGLGAGSRLFGGSKMSDALKIAASVISNESSVKQSKAGMSGRTGGYERRIDEWTFQSNLAARELVQLGRQILGSLIAEQVAYHEYLTIQKQIEQSQEVDRFLHEKFSNEELYAWMQGEISRLYYEYYRFAFDTAHKAEQTLKHELMRPEVDSSSFVKFNYWDGGRKGLLSGETLYLDVKRMELAYHENNKREYELTRHISLRQLDPLALLALKTTGACEVTLPEWLFDLDASGHYMRRIKTVGLSIPSVVGPYTSLNCTLTLLKSSLRKSPSLEGDEYARQGSEDSRFIDYFGAIESIVTSSGNNDSGLFETNLRDERFLPFEGAGAESTWKLELPADFRQFEYDTISDVILHMRYTARQGGGLLRQKAVEHLLDLLAEANSAGLALLFSLRHEFPSEWHRFVHSPEDFQIRIDRRHFPYFLQGKDIVLTGLELLAPSPTGVEKHTLAGFDLDELSGSLNDAAAPGGTSAVLALPVVPDFLERDEAAEVFVLVKYTVG